MNTLAMENRPSPTLFHSNPVLSRLSRVTERASDDAATYSGIASKTGFFLLMTLAGIVLQIVAQAVFAGEPVWQTVAVYGKFTLTLTKTEAVILVAVLLIGFVADFRPEDDSRFRHALLHQPGLCDLLPRVQRPVRL